MTPELDKQLVEDFPILYQDRYKDMQKTAMCWGFPGDGWEPLIRDLSEQIETYNRDNPNNLVIALQVKEKFGGLRFYVSGAPDWIHDAIDEAENKSETICELCGKPGKTRSDLGWILTLCDGCHEEMLKRR